ncbi:hypothetical protein [Levilactobacillus zymae]|uniref:hypothetical protein n=1 Tax=Levilactobacillus zymae TaxID=267363 RepID=UPI0028BA1850|nr:hypothetical protein [Levilactobacillus zymae]MDT6980371.1 hypothetical protein [Levilactobacillus zymae]
MRNDWQSDDDQPKTRADYRREQEQAEREANDRERQERKSTRHQPADDLEPDNGSDSRGPLDDHTPQTKQQRLGRRLNWAIFWLTVLIVAVYLILFFVEF